MINTLIGGLIVAAVSGLAVVAYKHPKGYEKILIASFFFIGFPLGWSLTTYSELSNNLDTLKCAAEIGEKTPAPLGPLVTIPLERIQAVSDSLSKLACILIISVAVYVYLIFLCYLPEILNLKVDTQEQQNGGGDDVEESQSI